MKSNMANFVNIIAISIAVDIIAKGMLGGLDFSNPPECYKRTLLYSDLEVKSDCILGRRAF